MWKRMTLSTQVSICVIQSRESEVVEKILWSLPERLHAKVVAIEENKGLDTLRVDELIGNLQTFEANYASTTKSKEIALVSTKYVGIDFDDKSKGNSDDDDFKAIFVKKFKKILE